MRKLVVSAGLVALALAACGGSAPTAQSPGAPKPLASTAAPAAKPEPPPSSTIRRSQIRTVLGAGPGAFLQRVTLDDHAVFEAGKFHGFRVARLNDADFFKGVDLKAGDVITHVNGFSIEHPEEALEAFKSLEVASELRVQYERDGVPRELRYAIVDDEPPPAPAKSNAPAPKR